MVLLWTLVTVSVVMIILTGAQAVWLLRESDSNVVRLSGQIVAVEATVARAQQQLEAQRVLLLETEQWMRARRPQAGP